MRAWAIPMFLGAFALAACGGGGKSDSDRIIEVVEQEAKIEDPSQCTELMTARFVEQIGFGADALASCRENEADGDGEADSVKTSDVRIDGEEARVEAAYTGGSVDGQTFELFLVKEDDEWKLDHIESFLVFDRAALLRELAGDAESDVPPELSGCIEQLKRDRRPRDPGCGPER